LPMRVGRRTDVSMPVHCSEKLIHVFLTLLGWRLFCPLESAAVLTGCRINSSPPIFQGDFDQGMTA
jgi:hypothetical protein